MFTTAVLVRGAAVLAAAAAVVAAGVFLADRNAGGRRRSADLARGRDDKPAGGGRGVSGLSRLLQWVGRAVAARNKAGVTDLRRRLVYAGDFRKSAAEEFLGARLLTTAGLLAGTGLAAVVAVRLPWPQAVLWMAAGAGVGFLAPSMYLSSRVKARQRLLHNALPDALDVMVMCVESGVGLNAAIDWVTDEIQTVHPVLGTELVIVRREIQLGLTAGDAFRNFADRSGVEDVRDLAAVLLQSERHGASVGKALRAYADTARLERQMWAEEMSQKAAVKIVFPTLLCIFPAMFTVLLGPAAHQMAKLFSK